MQSHRRDWDLHKGEGGGRAQTFFMVGQKGPLNILGVATAPSGQCRRHMQVAGNFTPASQCFSSHCMPIGSEKSNFDNRLIASIIFQAKMSNIFWFLNTGIRKFSLSKINLNQEWVFEKTRSQVINNEMNVSCS